MIASIKLPFVHEFVPATTPDMGITLLLLHGPGGNEQDLLPLGRELLPGAALLSPRGRVLENGMPRFFRRFAEGVFDVENLKVQTHALNDFIEAAAQQYGVEKNKVVALGYSNGANIATSLLLLHPHTLTGAVLFRPMVPFEPDSKANLAHTSVFLSGGMRDPIVPRDNTEALAALLANFGAETEVFWHRGGHELGQDDLLAAQRWLSRKLTLWRSRTAHGLREKRNNSFRDKCGFQILLVWFKRSEDFGHCPFSAFHPFSLSFSPSCGRSKPHAATFAPGDKWALCFGDGRSFRG